MHINIQRRIFKEDPTKRFSIYFNCDDDVWKKVWYQYKILGHSRADLKKYLVVIMKIPITYKRLDRWIERTEVYYKSQIALDKGACMVDSEFFGKYKNFVEKELSKNK